MKAYTILVVDDAAEVVDKKVIWVPDSHHTIEIFSRDTALPPNGHRDNNIAELSLKSP